MTEMSERLSRSPAVRDRQGDGGTGMANVLEEVDYGGSDH
jgi:hypothetical protein